MDGYHAPDVQAYTKWEVHKDHEDGHLELVDEDSNQASLEDVSVEEEEEDDDDCKQDTHILDPVWKQKHTHQLLSTKVIITKCNYIYRSNLEVI